MLQKFAGRLDVKTHIAGASRGGLLADQTLVVDCGLTARTGQPIQPSIFDETNI